MNRIHSRDQSGIIGRPNLLMLNWANVAFGEVIIRGRSHLKVIAKVTRNSSRSRSLRILEAVDLASLGRACGNLLQLDFLPHIPLTIITVLFTFSSVTFFVVIHLMSAIGIAWKSIMSAKTPVLEGVFGTLHS